MKILCAYCDLDESGQPTETIDEEIRTALPGHEITIVRSHEDMKLFMTAVTPPPDIILMDVTLRYSANSLERHSSGGFIASLLEHTLVRGLGIFVPVYFENIFEITSVNFHVIVSSKDCFTPEGKRDWAKLLGIVVDRISAMEQTLN